MANILGLNFGHDGSVCLVRDGKLEFAIGTERISKVKKQQGFTDEIINYVLDSCGLTLDDIDCVATNDFRQELFGNDYLVDNFVIQGKELKCYIIPHHLAHCASVFYASPFHEAHCFSMDCSMGKIEANSLVAYGKGKNLKGAIPSEVHAMQYFINTQTWAKRSNVEVFYFSSFDESWKVGPEGEVGAYWGLWDKDENIKFSL